MVISISFPRAVRLRLMSRRHTPLGWLSPLTVVVVGSALLVASCGKTGVTFHDPVAGASADGGAKAGSAGETASGGAATSGGARTGDAGSSSAGSDGKGGAGNGGSAGGGGPAKGGAASAGASTAEAGAGGADPLLGVDCRDTHCDTGDVCISCGMPGGAEWRCAPHPVTEPDAYENAIAACETEPYGYSECDGPEDCAGDQYCVAQEGADGRQRCRSTPAPGFCCFSCNALVNCTLCRDDRDCPDGESCNVVFEKLKGCKKN
jgi:hypothetical protein